MTCELQYTFNKRLFKRFDFKVILDKCFPLQNNGINNNVQSQECMTKRYQKNFDS